MKKKTLSFFLFGTLTLMLGGISVALYLIDWNKYRDTLAELASERMGVQVELAGDLSLGLLPRPTVSARAVRLSPRQAGFNDTIATADRINMHLGLSALLSGSMSLQSLAFEGLAASLAQTPEGWVIEGWPSPAVGGAQNDADTLLSLDRFHIRSGSIVMKPLDGRPVSFEGLDVSLEGRLPTGPLDWNGSAVIVGRQVAVAGKVVPTRTEGATSVRASVSVAENTLDFSGRVSGDGAVAGRFQAEGQDLADLANFLGEALGGTEVDGLPSLPFTLDVQVDRDSRHVSRLISRQMKLGETRGTIDLTLAEQGDRFHVTGSSSLGVIALEQWMPDNASLELEPAQQENDQQQNGQQGSFQPESFQDEAGVFPLSGSVDFSVEGVEYRNNQIQQVEAVVSFNEGKPVLQQLGALLPGASRFAFSRDGVAGGFVQFQSGGLQDVFDWLDIPVSDAVPAGRLRTADLNGRVLLMDNAWILREVQGTIDTSTISAEISGTIAPFTPRAVEAAIDTLNLDAYWPEARLPRNDNPNDQEGALPAMEFDLKIDALRWLEQGFSSVNLSGSLSDGQIAVTTLSLAHQGGRLDGSFDYKPLADGTSDIATTVGFRGWRFPIMAYFAQDAFQRISQFTLSGPATGSVAANGPSTALQVSGVLTSAAGSLELAGAAQLGEAWQGRLQGTLAHQDVGRAAAGMEIWTAGREHGIEAVLNVTFDGSAEQFSFNATGELAGGQLTSSGRSDAEGIQADISMSVPGGSTAVIDSVLAGYGYSTDPASPRRIRLSLTGGAQEWVISDLDFRDGEATLSGTVSASNGVIAGSLALQRLDLDRFQLSALDGGASKDEIQGEIFLSLDNVTWLGQSISAPAGQVLFENGRSSFTAGTAATINTSPLTVDVAFGQSDHQLTASVKASAFDIGSFSRSVGATGGFTGTVSAELDLTAHGTEGTSILETLSGQGRFEGGAGSLYFMSVPELVRSISSSNNASTFLGSIGTLLRTGTTDFASFRGSFLLDNGVALFDEVTASGGWGQLSLDGQVNIPGDYINMSGNLTLTQPVDAPALPVVYEGTLSAPNVRWTTRALERFAIAGIERRLRTRLFGELEQAQAQNGDQAAPNPGAVVSQLAVGLLAQLRARQAEKKRLEQEKTSAQDPKGDVSPEFEEQRP